MAGRFRIEHVATVPAGWKVRTVAAREHRVRVAFPPGRRVKGSGIVVEVLHPQAENPCVANPAELVLMGGNPTASEQKRTTRERAGRIRRARLANPYDHLSVRERLAFGRLGLGKDQLRSAADIRRARKMVSSVERQRNAFPNPAPVERMHENESARRLAGDFKHRAAEKYFVADEPHVPAGDYARLGDFLSLAIKPDKGGTVQEISFPHIGPQVLISDAGGKQLYIVGPQPMSEAELEIFTSDREIAMIYLGEARAISYRATKWHPQIEDAYRGKNLPYEHHFGDEGGEKPGVWYSRVKERLLIRGGDYTVEDVGIKN